MSRPTGSTRVVDDGPMFSVEPRLARDRPVEQMQGLFRDGWPAFITADQEVKRHLGDVQARFSDLELVLLDERDQVAATGWAVPIRWDGTVGDLPSGYTDALLRSLPAEAHDTLVIMGAQVHPDQRGQGLAGQVLTALRDLALSRGWMQVIAPVRPTLKARYPLTPIERFAAWVRPDGSPLDPWLRTHQRLGARVLAPAPSSQTMTGTVGQWEDWTGLVFPDTGRYVIPDGLSTLHIDKAADVGTYIEPNVWMQHSSHPPTDVPITEVLEPDGTHRQRR